MLLRRRRTREVTRGRNTSHVGTKWTWRRPGWVDTHEFTGIETPLVAKSREKGVVLGTDGAIRKGSVPFLPSQEKGPRVDRGKSGLFTVSGGDGGRVPLAGTEAGAWLASHEVNSNVNFGGRGAGRGERRTGWFFPPTGKERCDTKRSMAYAVDAHLRRRKAGVEREDKEERREKEGWGAVAKKARSDGFGLPRAPKLSNAHAKPMESKMPSPKKRNVERVDREHVDEAVSLLKERLLAGKVEETGAVLGSATLQSLRKKLHDLLTSTIETGHNNSILLLGPRGTGKTLVLEKVLENLEKEHEKDGESPVAILRVNGMVHSEERVALREIARQLCERHNIPFSKGSSFDDNLAFLHDIMRELKGHRACIFVLDEFDAFATRAKQTLLYNLLDAMQTSNVQAALVGISSRHDCLELLEKRVRSRFSHRKLLFSSPPPADPSGMIIQLLKLPTDPAVNNASYVQRFNRALTQAATSPAVRKVLDRLFDCNCSPRHVCNIAVQALCRMNREEGIITDKDFLAIGEGMVVETHVEVIKGLSVLELYMLVAMCRLEQKERESSNFEEIYAQYEEGQLTNTSGSSDRFSRVAAFRAFENLLALELIAFADGTRVVLKRYRPATLLVGQQDLNAALQAHPKATPFLKRWLSHEHVGNIAGHF